MALSGAGVHIAEPAECLARRPADHPVKPARGRVEGVDIAAKDEVRSSNDTPSLLLEGHPQEVDSRKDAQD